jgi:hypothetical protein
VPNDSVVEIRTDSSSCINSYAKIIKPHPKDILRKQMKKPNWQLWLRLADIITKKKLQLKLTKVKAHSKDLNNNRVDQLAKKAKEEPEVQWRTLSTTVPITVPEWNNIPIDISTRAFLKDYNEREILIQWTSQNRIQQRWKEEIQNPEKFDWKGLWDYCKDGGSLSTSLKAAGNRTFKTRLIHNELPTMDILIKRKSLEMPNNLCVLCQHQEETLDHLLTCKETKEIKKNIWQQAQDKLVSSWIPQHVDKKVDGKQSAIDTLFSKWTAEKSDSAKELINITIGFWAKEDIEEWTDTLQSLKISKTISRRILNKLSSFWCKKIRQMIWNPRCEKVQERKKNFLGKGKGKKTTTPNQRSTGIQEAQGKKRVTQQDPSSSKTATTFQTVTSSPNHTPGLVRVLWDKIKEGKKWLGI